MIDRFYAYLYLALPYATAVSFVMAVTYRVTDRADDALWMLGVAIGFKLIEIHHALGDDTSDEPEA